MQYEELTGKPNIPQTQAEILQFWSEHQLFEQSVESKTGGEVVFYDGPPFPTGKPHHGTVLVSFIKDMIARYWTMRGYSVPRVWGWDCHGLPIENQAEVQLGIEGKHVIENELGIAAFNDTCREIVSHNNESWRDYVAHMARWVDYDGAYKTMDTPFMESVLWAFKQCYDKDLIYRDYRVTPYCTHCETSLSISDTRESDSTRPRQDRWVVVKFDTGTRMAGKPVSFLAWTTTPWTLPANMSLAVGPTFGYAFVDVGQEILIASENCLSRYPKVFGEQPRIVKVVPGTELVGMTYEPLFPYFADKKDEGAFRVVPADYVDSEDGVGIVHTAPAFGEDDYWTCKKHHIPLVNPVDAKGRFTAEITDFHSPDGQKQVLEQNQAIIRFLNERGMAVADGTLEHNYPHCWRCKRPLIYKAMDAWYFNIEKIKDRLLACNEDIDWIPETVKHGRFGNWLANARDWNISRNRYWSTPMPIWECEACAERVVLGSIDEIHQASGVRLTDLHRQYMDEVTFPCACCGGTMRRIPEVLDCWFESGSVPFAQKHYPFENKDWFESHFPSDFIVEYTGQIRCWFYYLHVLAVALFDRPAFQHCIVHGTILAKDGKKLSKSSKNYTDPMTLMQKWGTDAFRLYLYQTNAMLIGDLQFDEDGIQDAYQQLLLPYWNACNFYLSYANIDGFCQKTPKTPDSDNPLDQWILAKLYDTAGKITASMDAYLVNQYVERLVSLVDGLTNWYIRRSRRRFWGRGMSQDKRNAYETLYYVLVNTAVLFAPVAPFLAEKLYKTFTDESSVHLADWPSIPVSFQDDAMLQKVELVQNVINLARSIRNKNRIKNRQPLGVLKVALSDPEHNAIVTEFKEIIAEELNVKVVEVLQDASAIVTVKYDPFFQGIRDRYPERIPEIIKAIKSGKFELREDGVWLTIHSEPERYDESILLVTYQAREGMHAAGHQGVVVSLDLTVTEELKREGLAREMVRHIQEARKQMGCDITDRIVISISGEYPEEWMAYVCRETLSEVGEVAQAVTTVEIEGEGGEALLISIAMA